jgi:SHS family lactate transporter-like MFS transporter
MLANVASLSRSQRMHAVAAGFLGWTLDAFDFFILVFMVDTLAVHFGVSKREIITTMTATLALRPVGALLFGLLADRFGRRTPLMLNVIYFALIEILCGFAPNFTVFLILRALFGIGMGGEWGVGASLAMEMAPKRWRGILSGILQSGYSFGYLLAAFAARFILPHYSWRVMFWIGGIPALLALYIRFQVPESEAWKQHHRESFGSILRVAFSQIKLLLFLLVFMTFMMFLSHGTQDLYPDFLKSVHHVAPTRVADIAVIYNIGAIAGAILFGQISDKLGRRRALHLSLLLAICVIPLWAFGSTVLTLIAGSFLMQAGVQGAWGVIPAHLNELSPDAVRGLVPGLAYQLGILFAAPTNNIEYALRDHLGYRWALAAFEITTIVVLAILVAVSREERGRSFVKEEKQVAVGN